MALSLPNLSEIKPNVISIPAEIPEQFTFQTKINLIENYGVNADDISLYKW